LNLGAAGCWCVFPCDCAPTLKEERTWWGSFLLSPAGMHVRNVRILPASARRMRKLRLSPRKHLFLVLLSCWVFWGGGAGGLVEDHNVGGTICSAFSQKREHLFRSGKRCCTPGTSHLTVNTYFFVSTIPKILTEFSFGIGMVNTEKYRPIPTEKYRLGKQL
jgi:hypothetical protein